MNHDIYKTLFILVILTHCLNAHALPNDTISFQTDFKGVSLNSTATQFSGFQAKSILSNKATNNPKIYINYCSKNTLDKAYAEITKAPDLPEKEALHFVIKSPNNTDANGKAIKGRVQNEFSVKEGFRQFENSVWIYLPKSMELIKNYPKGRNLINMQEYWNAPNGSDSTFRISLRMYKTKGIVGNMFFRLTTTDYWPDGKRKDNTISSDSTWTIPFGEWFELTTMIDEGLGAKGHYKLLARKINEKISHVIFDTDIQTKSSKYIETSAPSKGFRSLQPLKFYMGASVINYFENLGIPLGIYYTNWNFKGEQK